MRLQPIMAKILHFFKNKLKSILDKNAFFPLWDFLDYWIFNNAWIPILFTIFLGVVFELILIRTCEFIKKKLELWENRSLGSQKQNEDGFPKGLTFESWSITHTSTEERVKTFSGRITTTQSSSDFAFQGSRSCESHSSSGGTSASLSMFHRKVKKIFISHRIESEREYQAEQFSVKNLFSIMKTNSTKTTPPDDLSFENSFKFTRDKDLDVTPCPSVHLLLSSNQIKHLEENIRRRTPVNPRAMLVRNGDYLHHRSQEPLIHNQHPKEMVTPPEAQDTFQNQNVIQNEMIPEPQFTSHTQQFIHIHKESVSNQLGFAQSLDFTRVPFSNSTQDSFQTQDIHHKEKSQHFIHMPCIVETQDLTKDIESDGHFRDTQYSLYFNDPNKNNYLVKGQNSVFQSADFLSLSKNSIALSPTIKMQRNRKIPDNERKLNLIVPSLKAKKISYSQVFPIIVCHTLENKIELRCKKKKIIHQRKIMSDIALHLISVSKLITPHVKKYFLSHLLKVTPDLIKYGHFLQEQNRSPDAKKSNYSSSTNRVSLGVIENLEHSFMVNTDELEAPCSLPETNGEIKESGEDSVQQTFDLNISKHEGLSESLQKEVSFPKIESSRRIKIQKRIQHIENVDELKDSTANTQRCFAKEKMQKAKNALEILFNFSDINLLISLGSPKHEKNELKDVNVQVLTGSTNLQEHKPLMTNITGYDKPSDNEKLECDTQSNEKNRHQHERMSNTSQKTMQATILEPFDTELCSRLASKADTTIINCSHSALKQEKLLGEKETKEVKLTDNSIGRKPQEYDREKEKRETAPLLAEDFRAIIGLKQKEKSAQFEMRQTHLENRRIQSKEKEVQSQIISTQKVWKTRSCPLIGLLQDEKLKQSTDKPTDREEIAGPIYPPSLQENLPIGEYLIKTTECGVPFSGKPTKTLDGHSTEDREDLKRDLCAVATRPFKIRKKTSGTKNPLEEIKMVKEMLQAEPFREAVKEVVDSLRLDSFSGANVKNNTSTETELQGSVGLELCPPSSEKLTVGDFLSQSGKSNVPISRKDTRETHCGFTKKPFLWSLRYCMPVLTYSKKKKGKTKFTNIRTVKLNMNKVKPPASKTFSITGNKKKTKLAIKAKLKKINQATAFLSECQNTVCLSIHSRLQGIFWHAQRKQRELAKKTCVDDVAESNAFYDKEKNLQEEKQIPLVQVALQHGQYLWAEADQSKEAICNEPDPSPVSLHQEQPVNSQSVKCKKDSLPSSLEASLQMDPIISKGLQKASKTENGINFSVVSKILSPETGSSSPGEFTNVTDDENSEKELGSYPVEKDSETSTNLQVTFLQSSDSVTKSFISRLKRKKTALRSKKQTPVSQRQRAMREIPSQTVNFRYSKNICNKEVKDSQKKGYIAGICLNVIHSKVLILPKKHIRNSKPWTDKQRIRRLGYMQLMQENSSNGRNTHCPGSADANSFSRMKKYKEERKEKPENSPGYIFNMYQEKDHNLVSSDKQLDPLGRTTTQVKQQTPTETISCSTTSPIPGEFQSEILEGCFSMFPLKFGEVKDNALSGRKCDLSNERRHKKQAEDSEKEEKELLVSYSNPNHCGEIKCDLIKMKGMNQEKKVANETFSLSNVVLDVKMNSEIETGRHPPKEKTPHSTQMKPEIVYHEEKVASDAFKEIYIQDKEEKENNGNDTLLKSLPQNSQHFILCSHQSRDPTSQKLGKQGRRNVLFIEEQDLTQKNQSADTTQREYDMYTSGSKLVPLKSQEPQIDKTKTDRTKYDSPADEIHAQELNSWDRLEKERLKNDLQVTIPETLTISTPNVPRSKRQSRVSVRKALQGKMCSICVTMKGRKASVSNVLTVLQGSHRKNLLLKTLKSQISELLIKSCVLPDNLNVIKLKDPTAEKNKRLLTQELEAPVSLAFSTSISKERENLKLMENGGEMSTNYLTVKASKSAICQTLITLGVGSPKQSKALSGSSLNATFFSHMPVSLDVNTSNRIKDKDTMCTMEFSSELYGQSVHEERACSTHYANKDTTSNGTKHVKDQGDEEDSLTSQDFSFSSQNKARPNSVQSVLQLTNSATSPELERALYHEQAQLVNMNNLQSSMVGVMSPLLHTEESQTGHIPYNNTWDGNSRRKCDYYVSEQKAWTKKNFTALEPSQEPSPMSSEYKCDSCTLKFLSKRDVSPRARQASNLLKISRHYTGVHRKKRHYNNKHQLRKVECVKEEPLHAAGDTVNCPLKFMVDEPSLDTAARADFYSRMPEKSLAEGKAELQANLATTFIEPYNFFIPFLLDFKRQVNTVKLSENGIMLNQKKKPPISKIIKTNGYFTTNRKKFKLRAKMKAIWLSEKNDILQSTIHFISTTSNGKNKFKSEVDLGISKFTQTQPTHGESPGEGIPELTKMADKGGSNLLKGAKLHAEQLRGEKQELLIESVPFYTNNLSVNAHFIKKPRFGESEEMPLREYFPKRNQMFESNPEANVKIQKNMQVSQGNVFSNVEKSHNCLEISEPANNTTKHGEKETGQSSVIKEKCPFYLPAIVTSIARHLVASTEVPHLSAQKGASQLLESTKSQSPHDGGQATVNITETHNFRTREIKDNDQVNTDTKSMYTCTPTQGNCLLQKDKEKVKRNVQPFRTNQNRQLDPLNPEVFSANTVHHKDIMLQKKAIYLIDQEGNTKVGEDFSQEVVLSSNVHTLQTERQNNEFKTGWKTKSKSFALAEKHEKPAISRPLWSSYASDPTYPETVRQKDKAKIPNVKSAMCTKQIKLKAKKIPVSLLLGHGDRSNERKLRHSLQHQNKLELRRNVQNQVIEANFDLGCFTSPVQKLTRVKLERGKMKEKENTLPQIVLEKPSSQKQAARSGCNDVPRELEENIKGAHEHRTFKDLHQQFMQQCKLEDLQRKMYSESTSQKDETNNLGLDTSRIKGGTNVYHDPQDIKPLGRQKIKGLQVMDKPLDSKESLLIPGLTVQQQSLFTDSLLGSISSPATHQSHTEDSKEDMKTCEKNVKNSTQQLKKLSNKEYISEMGYIPRSIEKLLLLIKEQEKRRKKSGGGKKIEITEDVKMRAQFSNTIKKNGMFRQRYGTEPKSMATLWRQQKCVQGISLDYIYTYKLINKRTSFTQSVLYHKRMKMKVRKTTSGRLLNITVSITHSYRKELRYSIKTQKELLQGKTVENLRWKGFCASGYISANVKNFMEVNEKKDTPQSPYTPPQISMKKMNETKMLSVPPLDNSISSTIRKSTQHTIKQKEHQIVLLDIISQNKDQLMTDQWVEDMRYINVHGHLEKEAYRVIFPDTGETDYSRIEAQRHRAGTEFEFSTAQRIKQRVVKDSIKHAFSVPLRRGGSMKMNTSSSKGHGIYFMELDTFQKKTFKMRELLKQESTSGVSLGPVVCSVRESFDLESTKVSKEVGMHHSIKNISHLSGREGLRKTDTELDSKAQAFLCTDLHDRHKTGTAQKDYTKSGHRARIGLNSVLCHKRAPLHFTPGLRTVRKDSGYNDVGAKMDLKGEEAKPSDSQLKLNKKKVDISKNLRAKQVAIFTQNKEKILDFFLFCVLQQLQAENTQKQISAKAALNSEVINTEIEKASSEVNILRNQSPHSEGVNLHAKGGTDCQESAWEAFPVSNTHPLVDTHRITSLQVKKALKAVDNHTLNTENREWKKRIKEQNQHQLPFPPKNLEDHLFCSQNYSCVQPQLEPQTKEALSKIGNVSNMTTGIDLSSKEQQSIGYEGRRGWIFPSVIPEQTKEQDTVLPSESGNKTIKRPRLLMSKRKQSSDGVQISRPVSNDSSSMLRALKKELSNKASEKKQEVMFLLKVFLQYPSLYMQYLHENENQNDNTEHRGMKDTIYPKRQCLNLKKLELPPSRSTYCNPSNKVKPQYYKKEKMVCMKQRKDKPGSAAVNACDPIPLPHFKLDKEKIDVLISRNVKQEKDKSRKEKNGIKEMKMKGIIDSNITLKIEESSLPYPSHGKRLTLLYDTTKQQGRVQEELSKSDMKPTKSFISLPSISHTSLNSRLKVGTDKSRPLKSCLPPLNPLLSLKGRKVPFSGAFNRENLSNLVELKCLPQRKEYRNNILDLKDIIGLIYITQKRKRPSFKYMLHGKEPWWNNKIQKNIQGNKTNLNIVQNKPRDSAPSSPFQEWDPKIMEAYLQGITKFCLSSPAELEFPCTIGMYGEATDGILSSIGKAKHIPLKDRLQIASKEVVHSTRLSLRQKQSSASQELLFNAEEKVKKIQGDKQIKNWNKPSISSPSYSEMHKRINGEETLQIRTQSFSHHSKLQEPSGIGEIIYKKSTFEPVLNSVKHSIQYAVQKEEESTKTEKYTHLKENSKRGKFCQGNKDKKNLDLEEMEQGEGGRDGQGQEKRYPDDAEKNKWNHKSDTQGNMKHNSIEPRKVDQEGRSKEKVAPEYLPLKSSHELDIRIKRKEGTQEIIQLVHSQKQQIEKFGLTKSTEDDVKSSVKTGKQCESQTWMGRKKIMDTKDVMHPKDTGSNKNQLPLSHVCSITEHYGPNTTDEQTNVHENLRHVQERKRKLGESLTIASLLYSKLDTKIKAKEATWIETGSFSPYSESVVSSDVEKLNCASFSFNNIINDSKKSRCMLYKEDGVNTFERIIKNPKAKHVNIKKSSLSCEPKIKRFKVNLEEQNKMKQEGSKEKVMLRRETYPVIISSDISKLGITKEVETEIMQSHVPYTALQKTLPIGQVGSTKAIDNHSKKRKLHSTWEEEEVQISAIDSLTHSSGPIFKTKIFASPHMSSVSEYSALSKKKTHRWSHHEKTRHKQKKARHRNVITTKNDVSAPLPLGQVAPTKQITKCAKKRKQYPVQEDEETSAIDGSTYSSDIVSRAKISRPSHVFSVNEHNISRKRKTPQRNNEEKIGQKQKKARQSKMFATNNDTCMPSVAHNGLSPLQDEFFMTTCTGELIHAGSNEGIMLPNVIQANQQELYKEAKGSVTGGKDRITLRARISKPAHLNDGIITPFNIKEQRKDVEQGKSEQMVVLKETVFLPSPSFLKSDTGVSKEKDILGEMRDKMMPKSVDEKVKKLPPSHTLTIKELQRKTQEEKLMGLTNTIIELSVSQLQHKKFSGAQMADREVCSETKLLKEHVPQKENLGKEKHVGVNRIVHPKNIYLMTKKSSTLSMKNLSALQWKTREQGGKVKEDGSELGVALPKKLTKITTAMSSQPILTVNTGIEEVCAPMLTGSSASMGHLQKSTDSEGGIYIQSITRDTSVNLQNEKQHMSEEKEAGTQITKILTTHKYQETKVQKLKDEQCLVLTKSLSLPDLTHPKLYEKKEFTEGRCRNDALQRISAEEETVPKEAIVSDTMRDVIKQHMSQRDKTYRKEIIDRRGTDITLKSRKSPLSQKLHRTELHIHIKAPKPKKHDDNKSEPQILTNMYTPQPSPTNVTTCKSVQVDEERLESKPSSLLPQMIPAESDAEKMTDKDDMCGHVRKGKRYTKQVEKTVDLTTEVHCKGEKASQNLHLLNIKELVLNMKVLEEKVYKDKSELSVATTQTFMSIPSIASRYLQEKTQKGTAECSEFSFSQENFQEPVYAQETATREPAEADSNCIVKAIEHDVLLKQAKPQKSKCMTTAQQISEHPQVESECKSAFPNHKIDLTRLGTIKREKMLDMSIKGQKVQPEKCEKEPLAKIGDWKKKSEIKDNLSNKAKPKFSVSLPKKSLKNTLITHDTLVYSKRSVTEREQEIGSGKSDKPKKDRQINSKTSKMLTLENVSLDKLSIVHLSNSQYKKEQNVIMKEQVMFPSENRQQIKPKSFPFLNVLVNSRNQRTPLQTDVNKKPVVNISSQIESGVHMSTTEFNATGRKGLSPFAPEQKQHDLALSQKLHDILLKSRHLEEKNETNIISNIKLIHKKQVMNNSTVSQREGKLKTDRSRGIDLEDDKREAQKSYTVNLKKHNFQGQKLLQTNILDSLYAYIPIYPKSQESGFIVTNLKTKQSTMRIPEHPITKILSIIGCGSSTSENKLEHGINKPKTMAPSSKDVSPEVIIRSIYVSTMSPPHSEGTVKSKTNPSREKGICHSKFQEKLPDARKTKDIITIVKELNFPIPLLQESQPFVVNDLEMQKLPDGEPEVNLECEIEKNLCIQTREEVDSGNDDLKVIHELDMNTTEKEEIRKDTLMPPEYLCKFEDLKDTIETHLRGAVSTSVSSPSLQPLSGTSLFDNMGECPLLSKTEEAASVTMPTTLQDKDNENTSLAENLFPIYKALKRIFEDPVENKIPNQVLSEIQEQVGTYKSDDAKVSPLLESPNTSSKIHATLIHTPLLKQLTPELKNKLSMHLISKALEIKLDQKPEIVNTSFQNYNSHPQRAISEDSNCRLNEKKMDFSSPKVDTIHTKLKNSYQGDFPLLNLVKTSTTNVSSSSKMVMTEPRGIKKQETITSLATLNNLPLSHILHKLSEKEKDGLLVHLCTKRLEIQTMGLPRIAEQSYLRAYAQEKSKPVFKCIHSAPQGPKRTNRVLVLFDEKSFSDIDCDLQYKYLHSLPKPSFTVVSKPNALTKHTSRLSTGSSSKRIKVEASKESTTLSFDKELVSFPKKNTQESSLPSRKFQEPVNVHAFYSGLQGTEQNDRILSDLNVQITPGTDEQSYIWLQETNSYKHSVSGTQQNTADLADSHSSSDDWTDVPLNTETSTEVECPAPEETDSEDCVFLESNFYLSHDVAFEEPKDILEYIHKANRRKCRSNSKMQPSDSWSHSSSNSIEIESTSSSKMFNEEKHWTMTRWSRTSYSLTSSTTESKNKLNLRKKHDKSHMYPQPKERREVKSYLWRQSNVYWDSDCSHSHGEEKLSWKKRLYYYKSKEPNPQEPNAHWQNIKFYSERRDNQPFFYACVPADSMDIIPQTIRWVIPQKILQRRKFKIPQVAKISNSWNLWNSSKKVLGSLAAFSKI